MNPILKRTLTGLAVGAVVVLAALFAPAAAILPVVACLAALAIAEFAVLFHKKVPRPSALNGVAFLFGAALIGGGLWALTAVAARYGDATLGSIRLGNLMLLYVVAVVKFSDVGGFAFGVSSAKFLKGGNHKLCPSISPNKSWEGLLGSLFASSLVSCCFVGVTGFSIGKSVVIGVVAAIVGTFGDLVESKFKRWVGVKDSSAFSFTNGMGGLLDMLDSLLFAPAAILALL